MKVDRRSVVQRAIDAVKGQTYVEIGVRYGDVFLPVRCRRKIAIDPDFRLPGARKLRHMLRNAGSHYYQETSDDFFDRHGDLFDKKKIDVAFIDGMHTYAQSLRDFTNCLRYLSPHGVIIMHDCNPASEASEQIDASGDVWKTVVHLRASREDLTIAVLDCDYGLALISRGSNARLALDVSCLAQLTFAALNEHRVEWLNLQPPQYLERFLDSTRRSEQRTTR